MNENFWDGFLKTALNAQKARALAKDFGLIPEGAWKWGLRNLRKGKTPQQLGMAPQKMIDSAKRIGNEVETGAFWGKGAKGGPSQLGKGTPQSYDMGNTTKVLLNDPKFVNAAIAAQGGGEAYFKNKGIAANRYIKSEKPYRSLNTLHTHPEKINSEGMKAEKMMLEGLQEDAKKPYINSKEKINRYLQQVDPKIRHRMEKSISQPNPLTPALEHRHSSVAPGLLPSGVALRDPYNTQLGMDTGMMHHMHNIGTHHNIVSPGLGVGVHTLRPDKSGKSPTGKRLRSLLFREK